VTEEMDVQVARMTERLDHVIERVRELEREVNEGYSKLWRISWIVMLLLLAQLLNNVGLVKLVEFLK
jgi:hypothetical protein